MSDEINWKERYIDLEQQMLEMFKMTSDLIEKESSSKTNEEEHKLKASITKLLYSTVDDNLEVIAISTGENPVFIFELIDDKTKSIIYQKSEMRKNCYKFNITNLNDFRIKVYIKNETDHNYSDIKISRVINKKIILGV